MALKCTDVISINLFLDPVFKLILPWAKLKLQKSQTMKRTTFLLIEVRESGRKWTSLSERKGGRANLTTPWPENEFKRQMKLTPCSWRWELILSKALLWTKCFHSPYLMWSSQQPDREALLISLLDRDEGWWDLPKVRQHKEAAELGLRYSKYNIPYVIPELHQLQFYKKKTMWMSFNNKNIQCKCFCHRMVKQQNLDEAASGQFSTRLLFWLL